MSAAGKEAHQSLDARRIYLAGFSGTARAAWGFGSVPGARVAGVIGVDAGHPPGYQMIGLMPFVYFGPAQLAVDPYLEPLRDEAAYRELIEREEGPS